LKKNLEEKEKGKKGEEGFFTNHRPRQREIPVNLWTSQAKWQRPSPRQGEGKINEEKGKKRTRKGGRTCEN